MSTEETKTPKKTLGAWKKAKRHTVTLPSGFEVDIEIPNLPEMIKTGQIPNSLISAATGAIAQDKVTPELIAEQAEFYSLLVLTMVKEPQITAEDLPEIPYEDIEMLVELGTRARDIDALYNHIGGLHKSKVWREFRGLTSGDEDVADL